MKIELTEIIELTEAKTVGKTDILITGVSKVDDAEPGSLSFIYDKAYEKFQEETKAAALLVSPDVNKLRDDITYLVVEKPREQFNKVLLEYFQPEFPLEGIDESASVHPGAALGKNTAVGKNVVIGDGVVIGDNCKIFHNTVIGDNVKIDDDSTVFHNVTIREETRIGKRVIIHSGAVVGADGFGFVPNKEGRYIKIPQIGNVVLEDDVEIGANTCIDRAALGSTVLKRGVKIDNLVQIAHNVKVGENTVFSGQAGVSGSTVIGNNCIIAGQVGLADHIEIGDGVILTARTGVPKSIPKRGVYAGAPARNAREAWRIEAHLSNIKDYADRIKALEKKIEKLEEKKSDSDNSDS